MKIAAQVGEQVLEVTIEREDGLYRVEVGGESCLVDARKLEANFYSILRGTRSYEVSVETRGDGYVVRHGAAEQDVRFTDPSRRAREELGASAGVQRVTSVMPGKVVRVLVAAGDEVQAGQGLAVVEAMKMENEIAAPRDGRVRAIPLEPGQTVETGALIAEIE